MISREKLSIILNYVIYIFLIIILYTEEYIKVTLDIPFFHFGI